MRLKLQETKLDKILFLSGPFYKFNMTQDQGHWPQDNGRIGVKPHISFWDESMDQDTFPTYAAGYILYPIWVATQFPESQFNPNPTVKIKFYWGILIWNIISSQSWVYPILEVLILSSYPYLK